MPRVHAHTKLLALALAAGWALGPLATALHAAGHAHRYCAEHRAFEEGRGPALYPAQARVPSRLAVIAASGTSDRVDHVKCPVAPPSSRDVGTTSEHRDAAAPRSPKARLEGRWRSDHPPIQELALAPKASPPVSSVLEA
jgi:hypothetical protein